MQALCLLKEHPQATTLQVALVQGADHWNRVYLCLHWLRCLSRRVYLKELCGALLTWLGIDVGSLKQKRKRDKASVEQ